ncbi:uracil-DNA glycosylase [Sphaceloma murrayae]|uniref:Uracil-DNA glycosylase n=1 Tax=Sphaceloma murrayae TaxID=2082308 RepID=A0A2K1QFE5_9PEZI|nr:uracil-DNA glycosylase [Sphaceloma murrayae]
MPPKRYAVAPAQRQSNTGYMRNVINEVTSPENRTMVTAIGFFAAGVAFLHSSWSDVLKPPM